MGLFQNFVYSGPAGPVTAGIHICCPGCQDTDKQSCVALKKKGSSCFLPFRMKTWTPHGSRHRAVTASINVPSFFAWLKSELRSSSSTTDGYCPDRSRPLVSSLGTMCSSPSPPLALLRTMVLNLTLAEPEMWDELKDRKERQSSTRQLGTPSSSKPRRDAQSTVGTSMMTIVGRRDRNEKSKYIKLLFRFSLVLKVFSKSYEGSLRGGESFVPLVNIKVGGKKAHKPETKWRF